MVWREARERTVQLEAAPICWTAERSTESPSTSNVGPLVPLVTPVTVPVTTLPARVVSGHRLADQGGGLADLRRRGHGLELLDL